MMLVLTAFMLGGCSSSRKSKERSSLETPIVVVEDPHARQHVKKKPSDEPWITRASRVNNITKGLDGRHLSLWASHGRYYAKAKNRWVWQRPNLFCTNEDLFTQTFVVPYIIPMLENAGAIVFTPRERDWQTNEVVIDNDKPNVYVSSNDGGKTYSNTHLKEYNEVGAWKSTGLLGFANPYNGKLRDGNTPFTGGSARMANATKGSASAFAEYTPDLPEAGDYAVYVSYQSVEGSVDDAHYTVFHSGEQTEFRVNQQMGGGTWVYLGTFHFSKGDNLLNGVVLDNHSSHGGKVTTDAVRFGGGMGTIMRGDSIQTTSNLPRAFEGARYFCEWAGAPYEVYSQRRGGDDYADDINCRSMMTNWLAGGSRILPDSAGLHVPLELSLAFHSDAGFNKDFKSIYGSLGICTTDFHNGKLGDGSSRSRSRQLVDQLTADVKRDLQNLYGRWPVRDIYDRNYSETRRPEMPSAILEMLSHQSFPDMKLAHDPTFKFNLSRAIYKSIARQLNPNAVISPLAPKDFRLELDRNGKLTLNWEPQIDQLEPSATATSYILYVSRDGYAFDNGQVVKSKSVTMQLKEHVLYRFRVTAINDGGESFPSEELAAVYHKGKPAVLVVNAFDRLASPQVINEPGRLGFDIDADPGLSYGKTPAWVGRQQVFNTSRATGEGPGTFGYSGEELAAGFVAGNDFNYVSSHVEAIASSHEYSAVSCSSSSLPHYGRMNEYPVIDILLGNQRNDGYSISSKPAFSEYLQSALNSYTGGVFVSGSYVASDTNADFLRQRFNTVFTGTNRSGVELIHGMGREFNVYRSLNADHYASTVSDVIMPTGDAFSTLAYSDGSSAAIATPYHSFVMGFPFECIKNREDRIVIMSAILRFLDKKR